MIEEFDRGRGEGNEERERERVNKLLSSRVIMNKTVGRSKFKKKEKIVVERAALFLHTKVRFSNT